MVCFELNISTREEKRTTYSFFSKFLSITLPSLSCPLFICMDPHPYHHTPMAVIKEIREVMVSLSEQKMDTKKIAKTVKTSQRTVQRVLKMHKKTGDVSPGHHSGRKRRLTEREERLLKRIARKQPFTKPKEMQSTLLQATGKKISDDTVRRTLHKVGLHPHRPRRKPALSKAQREARLKFARKYTKKPAEYERHSWRVISTGGKVLLRDVLPPSCKLEDDGRTRWTCKDNFRKERND